MLLLLLLVPPPVSAACSTLVLLLSEENDSSDDAAADADAVAPFGPYCVKKGRIWFQTGFSCTKRKTNIGKITCCSFGHRGLLLFPAPFCFPLPLQPLAPSCMSSKSPLLPLSSFQRSQNFPWLLRGSPLGSFGSNKYPLCVSAGPSRCPLCVVCPPLPLRFLLQSPDKSLRRLQSAEETRMWKLATYCWQAAALPPLLQPCCCCCCLLLSLRSSSEPC